MGVLIGCTGTHMRQDGLGNNNYSLNFSLSLPNPPKKHLVCKQLKMTNQHNYIPSSNLLFVVIR